MPQKLYKGEWDFLVKGNQFVKTGEFRPPKRGEFFLSGAVPTAYKAYQDLDVPYHIMRRAVEHQETHCPCCQRRLEV